MPEQALNGNDREEFQNVWYDQNGKGSEPLFVRTFCLSLLMWATARASNAQAELMDGTSR